MDVALKMASNFRRFFLAQAGEHGAVIFRLERQSLTDHGILDHHPFPACQYTVSPAQAITPEIPTPNEFVEGGGCSIFSIGASGRDLLDGWQPIVWLAEQETGEAFTLEGKLPVGKQPVANAGEIAGFLWCAYDHGGMSQAAAQ